MRLDVKAFAATTGLVWGFGLFCLTWWVMAFDGATGDPMAIGRLYRGFEISPLGSLIGLAWGAADGFLGGLCFAWLYNRIVDLRERHPPLS